VQLFLQVRKASCPQLDLMHHPFRYRLSTGMTMLLALSVYQLIVTEKLPTTSDAVPLLGNKHAY